MTNLIEISGDTMSGDIEVDECDFCKQIKSVIRTYFKPSVYRNRKNMESKKLYNEGDYFIIVKSCFDCGEPVKI